MALRVELHNGLGKPLIVDAQRLVVYDDLGTPIMLAVRYDNGTTIVESVDHNKSRFARMLQLLGIRRTVIVTHLQPHALPEIDLGS